MITARKILCNIKTFAGKNVENGAPLSLSIEGMPPAPITAEPDEAEQAAAAILESMAKAQNKGIGERRNDGGTESGNPKRRKSVFPFSCKPENPEKGSKEYYRQLSEKIREAHAAEARAARRYISHTEECLHTAASSDVLGGSIAELEDGLFRHQDTVKREGGELLRRWQHSLASLMIARMQAVTGNEKYKN